MKILVVTHYYKHKNAMASIRPMKLAKYFAEAGHDVTVLTSMQKDNWCKQELEPEPSDVIREIYASEHKGMKYLRKLYSYMYQRGQAKRQKAPEVEAESSESVHVAGENNQRASLKQRAKSYISWLYYYSCDRLENYLLFKGLTNAAKEHRLIGYDYVVATYPGAGVHQAGVWIKYHRQAKHFIADYRDPAYNPGGRTRKAEIRHDKHIQDLGVKAADAIVCVSEGMAETLKDLYKGKKIAPIYVVKNGFEPEDHQTNIESGIDQSYFNFVYTGALYNGRRTVDLLAKALKPLIEDGTIDIDRIKIHYAGPDFEELKAQLTPYHMEIIAVDHGYVSRPQSLAMQRDGDVVLLLNWNQDNYTGVIPGKLYEYMASHKTICALIMGNQGDSETAAMIRNEKLGCACEQAVVGDVEALTDYMRDMYLAYRDGQRTTIASDGISKYEYRNLSSEYLKILQSIK